MTEQKIIINSTPCETRIALISGRQLNEVYVEDHSKRSIVSNIYKGRVSRVLPGINSAFIEIGESRTGFLFGGDVIDPSTAGETRSNLSELDDQKPKNNTPIEKILKQGQEIIVQVVKEPMGSKGPRLTQVITLPGRFLVLMPHFRQIGISRRIEDPAEKDRLKSIVAKFIPKDLGIIIRTAAAGVTEHELEQDLAELIKSWEILESKLNQVTAPSLLYMEIGLSEKIIRDLFHDDVEEILTDSKEDFDRLESFLTAYMPKALEKLTLYKEKLPIFEQFGIELALEKALDKRVEMKSGGYLVIEQTEALTSIDINTGKNVGRENARETILKTNLEAAATICEQLKLRNIGGIIIIDFIDMDDPVDREIIYNALVDGLRTDRARTNVLRISELGILQMTRKRTMESMARRHMELCSTCNGAGYVKNLHAESMELIREILRIHASSQIDNLLVQAKPAIIEYLHKDLTDVYGLLIAEKRIRVKFEPGFVDIDEDKKRAFLVSPLL